MDLTGLCILAKDLSTLFCVQEKFSLTACWYLHYFIFLGKGGPGFLTLWRSLAKWCTPSTHLRGLLQNPSIGQLYPFLYSMYCMDASLRIVTKSLNGTAPHFSTLNWISILYVWRVSSPYEGVKYCIAYTKSGQNEVSNFLWFLVMFNNNTVRNLI